MRPFAALAIARAIGLAKKDEIEGPPLQKAEVFLLTFLFLYGNILFRNIGGAIVETKGGFLISRIKQVGGRLFDRMLAEADIDAFNGAQGRILYVLWQGDGLTISQLSAQTSLANTTLTSMLDRMEQAALIQRTPSPTDRRALLIRLTDKARALREDYDRISQRMNELYYLGFTSEEISQFEGYLQRVLDNLQGGSDHE